MATTTKPDSKTITDKPDPTEKVKLKKLDPTLSQWYYTAKLMRGYKNLNDKHEALRMAEVGEDVMITYTADAVLVDGIWYYKNTRINRPAFFSIENDFVYDRTESVEGYIDDEDAVWDSPYIWSADLHEVPKV